MASGIVIPMPSFFSRLLKRLSWPKAVPFQSRVSLGFFFLELPVRAVAFGVVAIALLSLAFAPPPALGSPAAQTGGAAVAPASSSANAYCTPAGSWIGPTEDGPAKLPLECMYTA